MHVYSVTQSCPTLCDPMDCSPSGSSVYGIVQARQLVKVKVAQACLTLCDPMDYTAHGILQARILEWVALPSPGDLPDPGIKPGSPALQVDSLSAEPQRKPKYTGVGSLSYPFSSGSSRLRNQTRVSCIAGGFFTS